MQLLEQLTGLGEKAINQKQKQRTLVLKKIAYVADAGFWGKGSLLPRPVRAIRVTRGGEFSRQA